MVGNYVKMVIISYLRYDPIRERPCSGWFDKNAHILVADILRFYFVSRRIDEIYFADISTLFKSYVQCS